MKRTFFITLLQCILQSNIFIEFESISVYLFLAQGTYSSLVVQRKGPKALGCRGSQSQRLAQGLDPRGSIPGELHLQGLAQDLAPKE